MTKWLVYKHKFNYKYICGFDPITECVDRDCVLEFIVSIDKDISNKDNIKQAAASAIITIGKKEKTDDSEQTPTYSFGSLSISNMLDDIKKIFLTLLPLGEKKVHLWLDRTKEFSYWDDGSDVNSLCK